MLDELDEHEIARLEHGAWRLFTLCAAGTGFLLVGTFLAVLAIAFSQPW